MDDCSITTSAAGKRGGKPCIRGLRITVYDVLDDLASGMNAAEVLADFPYLTAEDIRACLAFAADRERHMMAVAAVKLRFGEKPVASPGRAATRHISRLQSRRYPRPWQHA